MRVSPGLTARQTLSSLIVAYGVFLWSGVQKQVCQLSDILSSETRVPFVDNEAWNAHYVIFLFQFFKMIEVVYFRSDIFIYRSDLLSCGHQLRTHRAGKRHQDLQICFLSDRTDICFCCFIQSLSRTCRIVQTEDERCEFMTSPTGAPPSIFSNISILV